MLVAPDSFKGSVSAPRAAAALAAGWRAVRPGDDVREVPQADGGEGTAAILAAAVPGARWHEAGTVPGPDGRDVPGRWVGLPDGTAVVELALTSGLTLLRAPDPLRAGTAGLGVVLRRAVEAGARRVLVAVGGSASTDGGTGALAALGARFEDDDGVPLPAGGGALARLARVDPTGLVPPPSGGVEVLVDVDAPLLGPRGAATVFGPQKGAGPADVALLDGALARLAAVLGGDPAAPGAGAAGGTAWGLAALWGARLVPGARRIAQVTGLVDLLARADVVLTGEGRFDRTSLGGKVVGTVLGLARDARPAPRVGVVAGSVEESAVEAARQAGLPLDWTQDLVGLAGSAEGAVVGAERWLGEAGARAARALGRPA